MFDPKSAVFQFPGQGSQHVGMAADLVARFPAAAQVFSEADRILGRPLSQVCFDGPAEALDETSTTQPALYVAGVATLRALESLLGPLQPVACAGHSLGEFTALTAAGALPFEDGLRLVQERGRLMREAGERNPGAMAALLGADIDAARAICEQAAADTGLPVVIGNDNCPGQVVLSGATVAIDRAMDVARERGVKRVVRLAVSVASHSPLMAEAAERFRAALDATPFQAPRVPVIGNTSAEPLNTVDDIKAELSVQLTRTVRWTESVRLLRTMGGQTFYEMGPKDVLTNFLKRIDREVEGVALNNADSVAALA
ncbi:MAG: ACP S-malonyltransferase [Anaerolineae bacterium]|nr:ACP S-malonyltransferase [Anaerolineae bacterium]